MRLLLATALLVLGMGNTSAMAARPPSLLDMLAGVPAPPHVTFVNGRAPGLPADAMAPAATDVQSGTIYSEVPLSKMARGHEVGHLLDAQVLTDGDRSYFERLMGMRGAWDQGTGPAGLHSPNEHFADWYGNAVAGFDPSNSWQSAYTTPPDPKVFRQFVAALGRLGHRKGLLPYK